MSRLRDALNSDGVLFNAARHTWRALGLPKPHPPLSDFAPDGSCGQPGAIAGAGAFANLFHAHQGRPISKWTHYFDIYDRYLARFRERPVTMLEIGVSQGGSLELWRRYLGPEARIFGIDIDPACAARVTAPNQVRIGSQDDPAFLRAVIEEMGSPDIVLDDGSHLACHQIASLEALFPHLNDGGVYMVEDVHTAYWPEFYDLVPWRPRSFIKHVHRLIDDMHGWYHFRRARTPAREAVAAIHLHDSIVVIEKGSRRRPSQIAAPS